jgi:hypothetical protein
MEAWRPTGGVLPLDLGRSENIVNPGIGLQLNHTHLGAAVVSGSARVLTRLDIFVLNSVLERY